MDGNTYSKEEIVSGGSEKALVIQECEDFANPELLKTLRELGLKPEDLRKVVSGEYADTREPIDETLMFNGIEEKAHLRFTQTGGELLEVAHCLREEASKEPPSEFDFQLRRKNSTYKILVGLKGEGVLRLPKTTIPAGMIYAATLEYEDVPFKKDTIAIIQAPTAWSFVSSKAGLEYLYISNPKYNPSVDKTAESL